MRVERMGRLAGSRSNSPCSLARALALALTWGLAAVVGCSGVDDEGATEGAEPDPGGGDAVDPGEGDIGPDPSDGFDPGGDGVGDGAIDPADSDAGADGTAPATFEISSISPTNGPTTGGTPVVIEGVGFELGAVVFFGASLAQNTTVLGPQRIAVTTPPHPAGLVDVRVRLPAPNADADAPEVALENAFLYAQAVQVTSVEPNLGHVDGGERVTITGTGFEPGSQVLFGSRPGLLVDVIDVNTIEVTAPMGHPGPVNVHVSNAAGVGTKKQAYTYIDEPRITVISPAAGPLSGGNDVLIEGHAFLGELLVWFGDAPAEVVAREGSTRALVRAPAGAALGAVTVELETSFGVATVPGGYAYLDPSLASGPTNVVTVSPGSGPLSGGTIVEIAAYGLNSLEDTLVLFGEGFAGTVLDVDPNLMLARVRTPGAPNPGAVDVTVATSNGTHTLIGGFTYLPEILVTKVTPAIGPAAGGTAITIQGKGFEPGAQVRVGTLFATDVQVVDSTTIVAVTPQGAPGYAAVQVRQGVLQGTLPQGFFYQGTGQSIYVVDPNVGAIAGGTFVQIIGQGFSGNATVRFDGVAASHVTVVDSTLITCKTPPGQVGTVPVEVTTSAGPLFLPDAFTYFNPGSSFGGTWGSDVGGALNVSVRDGQSGTPVPDAFVILGTNPTTPYQGFTNLEGQITFSGPDVFGEQIVSASKAGYESNSVVEFDAENITILLVPIPPPTPSPPPPGVGPPMVTGRLFGLSKYTVLPFGNCANKVGSPAPLCQMCTSDAACGEGNKCSKIQPTSSLRYCTTPCLVGSDCPAGFVCGGIDGSSQCVPAPGSKVARCFATKPHIFADDIADLIGAPGPDGQWQVTQDGQPYTIYAYPPRTGVVCLGGYLDFDTGEFVPLTLGVARQVFTAPETTTEDVDIELEFQLNRNLTLAFSNTVTPGPEGPNFTAAFSYLDLGADGVYEFLHALQTGLLGQPLIIPRMLDRFTGILVDASFTFLGGAFSATADNTPVSLTMATGVKDINTDVSYRLDGGSWGAFPTGIIDTVRGVWGHGPTGVYAVGDRGLISYFGGGGWTAQSAPTTRDLFGVWGFGQGQSAIAVGASGTIVHFNGVSWQSAGDVGTNARFNAVWGPSPDNVYAVGQFVVAHYNGSTWTTSPPPPVFQGTQWNFEDVHGLGADAIWMVGRTGRVTHFNGNAWTTQQLPGAPDLFGVWAVAPDNVFAVGANGVIRRFNGTVWESLESPTTRTLRAVWAASASEVYAVGDRGTILRFDGTTWTDQSPTSHLNAFTSVFGWAPGYGFAMGANEYVIGPLLEVPIPVAPTQGQVHSEYRIDIDFAAGEPASFQYFNLTIPGLMGDTPEWFILTDGHVKNIDLPEFPLIEGTPGIADGPKNLFIARIYKPGFDIDNYDYTDLNTLQWRSWAYDRISFIKN